MKPTKRRGDERVEHHRAAAALGLARADQRERALGRLAADRLGVERAGSRPSRRRGRSSGRRPRRRTPTRRPSLGGLVRAPRSRASWRARPRPRVRVDGVLDLGDARPARARRARPPAPARPCARSSSRASSARRARRPAVAPSSSGRPGVLVRVGHRGRLARGAGGLGHALVREVGAVGVAGALARRRRARPTPRPPASLRLSTSPVVDPDAPAAGLLAPGLGVRGAGGQRPPRPPGAASVLQAHDAVPPTVSSRIRTCGWPDAGRAPTGRSLPQKPVVIVEVVGDPVDRAQRLEAVADQRRAAHRRGHLAALDQVALGDAEDEVAGRRLHLAAAERDRVEAALDARR